MKRFNVSLYGKTPKGLEVCKNLGNGWIVVDRKPQSPNGQKSTEILVEPRLDSTPKYRESKRMWIDELNDPDYQVIR